MTNKEILEKAIQKAIDGGWDMPIGFQFIGNQIHFMMSELTSHRYSYHDIIFNHDFAIALWGASPLICSQCERHHETISDCDCGGWPESGMALWKYQLQQMVIADDPIKYLGENID